MPGRPWPANGVLTVVLTAANADPPDLAAPSSCDPASLEGPAFQPSNGSAARHAPGRRMAAPRGMHRARPAAFGTARRVRAEAGGGYVRRLTNTARAPPRLRPARLRAQSATLAAAGPRGALRNDFSGRAERPATGHRRRSRTGGRQRDRGRHGRRGAAREDRTRVIAIGIVAATLMRVAFAAVTVQLLQIVGLLLAGGLVLLWVAWKLWREIRARRESERAAAPEPGGGEAAASGHAPPKRMRTRSSDRDRRRVDVARQRARGRRHRPRPHLGCWWSGSPSRWRSWVSRQPGSRASSSTAPGSPTSVSRSSSTWRWR